MLLAQQLRTCCKEHCPHAYQFAMGLSETSGRDAFLGAYQWAVAAVRWAERGSGRTTGL